MKSFSVNDIPAGSHFSEPLYIDDGFVLTAPEMPFTDELKKILTEWRFDKVKSDGEPQESHSDSKANNKRESYVLLNDNVKLIDAGAFCSDFKEFTNDIFLRLASKARVNYGIVAEKMRDVCEEVKTNRRFLLQVLKDINSEDDADFLAAHSVKSTIISIIIGMYLKLPAHRIIELGVAAMLHEVGMLKLPPHIIMSKTELSPQERNILMRHPIFGFELLKSLDFPMAVNAASLEHHEREDGGGYPYSLAGENIGLYGKIIAVACSYDAITSKRPHKDARGAHEGITDLLRNEGRLYDETVIRALVFSLSIYPIGQHVQLSNGIKGQVVDVNPADPRFPIVQLLDEKNADSQNRIIKTSQMGIHIQIPLPDPAADPDDAPDTQK
ncbi:MAG: HD-GYP domain-containing protein [Spirochaetaceae bacterium]|jgi:HD-GYP domain-containing protein (c-di-GMP phosphodiesterase class II)|nr:HD-GYP domain-containing protein [Spirochaetaceae bacterium]